MKKTIRNIAIAIALIIATFTVNANASSESLFVEDTIATNIEAQIIVARVLGTEEPAWYRDNTNVNYKDLFAQLCGIFEINIPEVNWRHFDYIMNGLGLPNFTGRMGNVLYKSEVALMTERLTEVQGVDFVKAGKELYVDGEEPNYGYLIGFYRLPENVRAAFNGWKLSNSGITLQNYEIKEFGVNLGRIHGLCEPSKKVLTFKAFSTMYHEIGHMYDLMLEGPYGNYDDGATWNDDIMAEFQVYYNPDGTNYVYASTRIDNTAEFYAESFSNYWMSKLSITGLNLSRWDYPTPAMYDYITEQVYGSAD